jgi:hypothetical protein
VRTCKPLQRRSSLTTSFLERQMDRGSMRKKVFKTAEELREMILEDATSWHASQIDVRIIPDTAIGWRADIAPFIPNTDHARYISGIVRKLRVEYGLRR